MEKNVLFKGVTDQGIFCRPLFTPFEKSASILGPDSWETAPEIRRVISSITPRQREENAYVLVNAMGAGEYFGSNINADFFEWNMLAHEGEDYGYKTFLRAHCFTHHANKDPTKAIGKPIASMLNSKMKRVELVIEVNRAKAKQEGADGIITRVDNGEFPDVSMGTRVPYDVCSICGNKSKTRDDYCFPPGTPVLLADGQFKPIEEIAVGDVVVTHTGKAKEVTHLLPSETDSGLVYVEAYGFGSVSATPNHPFWSARLHSRIGGRSSQLQSSPPDWVRADSLKANDTVFLPIPKISEESPVSSSKGRLLGLYLAEGSPLFSAGVPHPKGASFTFHKDETDLVEQVISGSKELSTSGITYSTYDYKQKRAAVDVKINSREVAEWLLLHGGRGSHLKALNPAIWSYGVPFSRSLLHGWAEGDGSYDGNNLRVATSSEYLARQMQMLAAGCGVLASIHLYDRDTNFGHQKIWYVSFSGDAARAVLEERSQKVFEKQSKLFFHEGYLCTTIRKVEGVPYSGSVYNFEVDGDHSYVAGGFAVHNCEHMRPTGEFVGIYGPNKILPDGRKIFVYNPYPRFFDISFVFIGADKTAKVMTKLASSGSQVCLGPVCTVPVTKTAGSVYKNSLGTKEGMKIWVVDGPEVRRTLYPDFTMGGNPARYKFVPEGEIWIDSSLGADEVKYTIDHELLEYRKMMSGDSYNEAHDKALALEARERASDTKTASAGGSSCGGSCSCGGVCGSSTKETGSEKLAYRYPIKTSSHRKLGEIIKQVPAGSFSVRKLPSLESSEPDIPEDALDSLADIPLGTVSSGMSGLGMLMKPREFQRIVLIRMGERDLAEAFDRGGIGFRRDMPPAPMFPEDDIGGSAKSLLPLLSDIIPHRTAFGGPMNVRITIIKRHNPIPTPEEIKHPLLDKVGSAYSAYRVSSLEKLALAARVVESDYQLREAVLGETLSSMFKTSSYSRVVDPDSVTYLMGAYLEDRGLSTVAALSEKAAAQTLELLGLSG